MGMKVRRVTKEMDQLIDSVSKRIEIDMPGNIGRREKRRNAPKIAQDLIVETFILNGKLKRGRKRRSQLINLIGFN